jgi:hypothetical protein
VEELHRETKQLTALERCQCRKARALWYHIACVNLVWVILKRAAYALKTTVYQLKEKLLYDYVYLLHRKNVQRFAGAPRGLYRSQDLFANLQVRAVYVYSALNNPLKFVT